MDQFGLGIVCSCGLTNTVLLECKLGNAMSDTSTKVNWEGRRLPRVLPGVQGVTAVRDSLYTAGYLGVCPVLHEYVQNMDAFKGRSPTVQFLAAGITAGLLGAVVTHPADTIKTRQQVRPALTHPRESPAGCW